MSTSSVSSAPGAIGGSGGRAGLVVVAAIMAIAVGVGLLFGFSYLKNAGLDMMQVFILLSSSMVALVGVTITGYIFSSESLRQLADDDYKYQHCSDRHKAWILRRVKWQFVAAIVLIVLFSAVSYFEYEDSQKPYMAFVMLALFSVFLCFSIDLDIRMMDLDTGLVKSARKLLDEGYEKFDRNPVVRINPQEYKTLTINKDPSEHPDFFTERSIGGIGSNLVVAIRGKESEHYKIFRDENDIIAFREMSDEYDPETALSVFEGIESIICQIAGIASGSIRNDEKMRLEAALGVGIGRKEDSGLKDDIVDYYFAVSKYRDNLFIVMQSDVEKPTPHKAKEPDGTAWYCKNRLEYRNKRESAEKCTRAKTDNQVQPRDTADYVEKVTPYIFVLRFELCKNLAGRALTGMNLQDFDFSYGNLEKVLMDGSILMGCSFYRCNLAGASLKGCDLTDAVIENSNCCDMNMSGAVIENVGFRDVNLVGARFEGCSISECLFPNLVGSSTTFAGASIINTRFFKSHLPDSTFSDMNIINSSLVDSIFKDNDMSGSKIATCLVKNCNMYGSDFTKAIINFSTVENTTFMLSKFEDGAMTSNIFIRDVFDNCQIKDVILNGTEIFSCSFSSSQISDCDFTRVIIHAYDLKEETRDNFLKRINGQADKAGSEYFDDINNFTNSIMVKCHFTDAIIKYADMTAVNLDGSIFSHTAMEGCIMDHCNMMGQYVSDSDYCDISMRSATFRNSSITSCKMKNCNFSTASLKGVTITNTDFIQCIFDNSDLSGVKIIDTTWEGCDMTYLLDNIDGYFVGIRMEEGNRYRYTDNNEERYVRIEKGYYPNMQGLRNHISGEIAKAKKLTKKTAGDGSGKDGHR